VDTIIISSNVICSRHHMTD